MSTEQQYWVGIDVSKRKLDVALCANDKIKSKTFSNDRTGFVELHSWMTQRGCTSGNTHLCMEATGPYSEAAALALVELHWTLSVVNPARVKGFAQSQLSRNKTDRADAALLARFCQTIRPAAWTPPSQAWRELRAMVDRLQALKDMHQQECNRQEAYQATGEHEMLANVAQHLGFLEQQIERLSQQINDHIDRDPTLKQDADLMASIPGIGHTTIAKVLAYIGDVRRFANAKALAAFIGVSPQQKQSGTSVKGRTMLSRSGHAALRKALYMPGLVALRHNKVIEQFGNRLRANGLAPKAVVGAAMRKLVHLIYGVIKSGQPFNPAFCKPAVDAEDGI